jgi:Holliday junction DNA helicase RuvB
VVSEALALEGVDKCGLTPLDRRYLSTIIEYYHGGPVGIEAIAATLQEETDTLVDVVEPYLLKTGLMVRTSSGRNATESAYRHLGFSVQQRMF